MKYKGICWAGLHVVDMEKAIAFYRDVVGLPLLRQGKSWAHFDASNETLFELFSGGKASSAPKTPEQQSLCIGFRVDDLNSSMEKLKAKGINFIDEIGRWRSHRWIYFSDPEGNLLEITEHGE